MSGNRNDEPIRRKLSRFYTRKLDFYPTRSRIDFIFVQNAIAPKVLMKFFVISHIISMRQASISHAAHCFSCSPAAAQTEANRPARCHRDAELNSWLLRRNFPRGYHVEDIFGKRDRQTRSGRILTSDFYSYRQIG